MVAQFLERTYAEVAQLPEADQDANAALTLKELEDEQK